MLSTERPAVTLTLGQGMSENDVLSKNRENMPFMGESVTIKGRAACLIDIFGGACPATITFEPQRQLKLTVGDNYRSGQFRAGKLGFDAIKGPEFWLAEGRNEAKPKWRPRASQNSGGGPLPLATVLFLPLLSWFCSCRR